MKLIKRILRLCPLDVERMHSDSLLVSDDSTAMSARFFRVHLTRSSKQLACTAPLRVSWKPNEPEVNPDLVDLLHTLKNLDSRLLIRGVGLADASDKYTPQVQFVRSRGLIDDR